MLGESQAPDRLVRLTRALLGWLRGGLGIVSLASCALFTAFTGASGVTIVALGALLYPALRRADYPERFSLGLVTTSGSLGLLFAPALPLILYGVVAQQMNLEQPVRIDDVFAAGLAARPAHARRTVAVDRVEAPREQGGRQPLQLGRGARGAARVDLGDPASLRRAGRHLRRRSSRSPRRPR